MQSFSRLDDLINAFWLRRSATSNGAIGLTELIARRHPAGLRRTSCAASATSSRT